MVLATASRKTLVAVVAGTVYAVAGLSSGAARAAPPRTGVTRAADGSAPAVSARAAGSERGAYEWESSAWYPDASSYAATLARLASLGVNTLYVDITGAVTMIEDHSSQLTAFLSGFAQLVKEADGAGFRVDAVGGDPAWATTSRKGPGQLLSAVAEVVHELPAEHALDGVQFDVEPWALHGWHSHRAAYVRDWLDFVQSTVTSWQADGLSGRLGFTVPFWFDGVQGGALQVTFDGSTGYPFQLALGILAPMADTVLNVMAYRNATAGTNGSLALFNGNLDAATSLHSHTTLLLGQETGDAQPAEITFYGLGCSAFDSAAQTIAATYAGDATYAGIAVDDVETLEALCPS